jgi:hypothetical protein
MVKTNTPKKKITKYGHTWTLGKKYDGKGYYIYEHQREAEEVASVRRHQGYLSMVQHDVEHGWLVYIRRDWTSSVRR